MSDGGKKEGEFGLVVNFYFHTQTVASVVGQILSKV